MRGLVVGVAVGEGKGVCVGTGVNFSTLTTGGASTTGTATCLLQPATPNHTAKNSMKGFIIELHI
jgi:hypothetical protein